MSIGQSYAVYCVQYNITFAGYWTAPKRKQDTSARHPLAKKKKKKKDKTLHPYILLCQHYLPVISRSSMTYKLGNPTMASLFMTSPLSKQNISDQSHSNKWSLFHIYVYEPKVWSHSLDLIISKFHTSIGQDGSTC